MRWFLNGGPGQGLYGNETWFVKIWNFHVARATNGPTEALNNRIRRIERVGFGIRDYAYCRIRVRLSADKPN